LIDEGTNLVKADIEPASDTDSDESENDDDSEGSLADFIDDGTETESGRDGNKTKKVARYKAKGKGKTIDPSGPKEPKSTLAQLKLASRKNVKARRKYLRRLAKDFVTSGKIEKAMEILEQITARDANEKTIIFSQFTSLLDLLEVALKTRDYIYERYDGSMSSNSRNDAVIEFTSKANCKIMLVSLKAGNSGLNLTCASQVIMMDPFWNPFIEEQAIDRAHRIGQRRPVQVHRILVASTVEDRIIALQEKKRTLIEGALDENASASIGRLGVQELAFLFVIHQP
jgi:SNF2 family DNA or RNA helicase